MNDSRGMIVNSTELASKRLHQVRKQLKSTIRAEPRKRRSKEIRYERPCQTWGINRACQKKKYHQDKQEAEIKDDMSGP